MAERRPPDAKYGLGLDAHENRLVPHNPLWAEAFAAESALIAEALRSRFVAIEHIGSTAVPDLAAKPIIDVQIGVEDLATAIEFVKPMAVLGYDLSLNHGIPGHHVFGRGTARSFLVHVVVHGGEQWLRPLRFRDRLRASAQLREQYEALKRALEAETDNRAEYTAGKTAFVEAHSG